MIPLPTRVHDLRGRTFGRLTVREFAGIRRHAYWLCDCTCGSTIEARSSSLVSGRIVSCGCQRRDPIIRQAARLQIGKRRRSQIARLAARARWHLALALACILYICVPARATDDPGGWSKAKWGMTDDELVQAFDGQVAKFAVVDKYQKARVGIESLEIAGAKFRVYMSPGPDDRLDHILFVPTSMPAGPDATFQSLQTLLVEKYGRPWKTERGGVTQLQWNFPTTEIRLSCDVIPVVPGVPPVVMVRLIYQHRRPNPL